MHPYLWGPQAWHFLHSLTFNYPSRPLVSDKQKMLQFLMSLGDVLPCEKCAAHFREQMQKFPPALDSKAEFMQWMVDTHNRVNVKNGKRMYTLPEVQAIYKERYDQALARVPANDPSGHEKPENADVYFKYGAATQSKTATAGLVATVVGIATFLILRR